MKKKTVDFNNLGNYTYFNGLFCNFPIDEGTKNELWTEYLCKDIPPTRESLVSFIEKICTIEKDVVIDGRIVNVLIPSLNMGFVLKRKWEDEPNEVKGIRLYYIHDAYYEKYPRLTKLSVLSAITTNETFREFFDEPKNLSEFEKFISNDENIETNSRTLKAYCLNNNIGYRELSRFTKDYYVKVVSEFLDSKEIPYRVNAEKQFVISKDGTESVMLFIDMINEFLESEGYFQRTQKFGELGIRCIQLFEYHLLDAHKWHVLKDIIMHASGKTPKKIYARKLHVKYYPKAVELKPFFEENNIQGYRNATFAFGLLDENENLLMAYSVGHAWLGKGNYDCEIARGACKLGCSVVGGASKLWKAILQYAKEHDIKNIVYYVDTNYYSGQSINFLKQTDFVSQMFSFWNYWSKDDVMKNREPTRHKEIVKGYKEARKLLDEGYSLDEVRLRDTVLKINNVGTITNVCNVEANLAESPSSKN